MASYQKYTTKSGELWMAKFITGIDPLTGKYRHTTKRGFKTKKDAKLYVAQIEQCLTATEHPVAESTLFFKDVIDMWMKEYETSGVKRSTIVNRKTTGIPHVKRLLGEMKIKDIRPSHYQSMLDTLVTEKYARGTIEIVNAVGKLSLKYALVHGMIKTSPADGIKIPEKRKTIEELKNSAGNDLFLEKSELLNFLDVVKKSGNLLDYAIFQTLAFTGMRIGELLALQWEDIDFKEQTIRIIKTLFREHNTVSDYELTTPKTACSIRRLVVDKDVFTTLAELRERQNEVKKAYPDYYNHDFVFAKLESEKAGYPELRTSIAYRLGKYLQKAKITKNITLHNFRHTHISLLAQAGVNLPAIQERVGHEDSKTTTGIYLHVTEELNREIVSQFSNLLKI